MKMIHSIPYIAIFLFWFKGGAQENYLHKDTDFCTFLLKTRNFAILLPVSSHVVTLKLFLAKNLILISII
jgi:hypothetical protein